MLAVVNTFYAFVFDSFKYFFTLEALPMLECYFYDTRIFWRLYNVNILLIRMKFFFLGLLKRVLKFSMLLRCLQRKGIFFLRVILTEDKPRFVKDSIKNIVKII